LRTLRQIPRVVGQTDAGETIYEARSARLVLRGDAAHFNRLVRCSKCGREVPGRAVLSSADLDQPAQAVMCNDCVEAATLASPRPGPPAEPVATDEPAVVDAQAEMNMGPDALVDELDGLGDDEAEPAAVSEFEEAEYGMPPALDPELVDNGAGVDEDDPVLEEDGVLVAVALDDIEVPALAADDGLAGWDDAEWGAPAPAPGAMADEVPEAEDEEPAMAGAGVDEPEPPVFEYEEPVVAGAALDEQQPFTAATGFDEPEPPPAPEYDEPIPGGASLDEQEPAAVFAGLDDDETVAYAAGLDEHEPVIVTADYQEHEPALRAAIRPDDEGLVRRIEALEERLAGVEDPDPLRLVAIEETVNRLADRADAQASLQVAIQARLDEIGAAVVAAQGKKETDKLRRRLDQMGERLQQLQATTDAEWAGARSETATLSQTIADLGDRVVRLAEQAGDTAGAEDERLAAVEAKVDETATHLASALEAQRRELEEGLRDGLAGVLSAVPPSAPSAPPAAVDDHDARFRAMERQLEQSGNEVAELNELHAALDAGLGALRGEIGDVRTALSRVVDSKADLEDRLETFVRMSLVPEGAQGRKAKKTAESTLGTLSAAVQDLLREQRQLKDSVATLEHASDAATAAAARASMQVSSMGPLRSDVKLLHQEMLEQQEALDAVRRTVDRLRQAPAAPPPAAAPPPRAAKKPAPAKKAVPAKKVVGAKKAAPAAKPPARAAKPPARTAKATAPAPPKRASRTKKA
jgi:hypothetical protein